MEWVNYKEVESNGIKWNEIILFGYFKIKELKVSDIFVFGVT